MPTVGGVTVTDEQLKNPRIRKKYEEAVRAESRSFAQSLNPGATTVKQRGGQLLDIARKGRELFFPSRRESLERIQEERQQTLTPEAATQAITQEEKEMGVIGLNLGLRTEGTEFERFLDTKRLDPIGAIGQAKRVIAGLSDDAFRRIIRSNKADEIADLLRRGSNVSKNEIDDLSRLLARQSDPTRIERTLGQAELRAQAPSRAGGEIVERERFTQPRGFVDETRRALERRSPSTVDEAFRALDEIQTERAFLKEAIDNHPAKPLGKFVNRSGELPQVTGEGSKFARTGDDIVTELGFRDSEEARQAYQELQRLLKRERALADEVKDIREVRKDARSTAKEERKVLRAELRGAKAQERVSRKTIQERRTRLRALKDRYQLSNNELSKIRRGRDISLMSEEDFGQFIFEAERHAGRIFREREARTQLRGTIFAMELDKVDNLRKALNLPPISKMSTKQLLEFDQTLSRFKVGDEFLSVRQLETVSRTDLEGIKTLREAKERLAQELGVPVESLDNIKVGKLDRFRYDTALAEQNPFYMYMVDSTNESLLNAEARYLEVEETLNKLISRARKSRKRPLGERILGQDKKIFEYLNSGNKAELAKSMTQEELAAADYIINLYSRMRDYLVQFGTLKKYRQDYITHIRRGFLEEWKETNILNAFKNVFKNYQDDLAKFDIIDDTGNVLALEKFFGFSMRRSGAVEPTQNVAGAVLAYVRAFEKKAALDSVVPKLDIYANSLTPKARTPRGLELDNRLKTLVKEWINTKKGRVAKIVGIEQGGVVDLTLRAFNSFLSIIDLAINIPVGFAARYGENATDFAMVGTEAYSKGLARARTAKGKRIVEKYKNFVGRSPWDEIRDAAVSLPEKIWNTSFGMFSDATVRANKTFLLGSLTKEEWASETVSTRRLAQMKRELGRFRVVEGAKSIFGATSLGSMMTKYKTFAIPILSTTIRNLITVTKTRNFRGREAQELLRSAMLSLSILFVVKAFVGDDDDKDDSFTSTVLAKAYRDSMSLVGALDPQLIASEPRFIGFVGDLAESVSLILTLEKYKQGENEGRLRGVEKLKRTLVPRAIRQFIPSETAGSTPSGNPLLQGASSQGGNPLLKGISSGRGNPLLE